MAEPFTSLQWHAVVQLAEQARISYAQYTDPAGPFYGSPTKRRLAREAERTLREEANKSLAHGVMAAPAHSKSEYKRRVALGDPSVTPPDGVDLPDGAQR